MSRGTYNSTPPENRRNAQENGVQVHSHNYWNRLPPILPRSNSTRGPPVQNPRRGTHDVWLPYQERAIQHPNPFTRTPTPQHSHVHIFVLDNDFPRSTYSRPRLPAPYSPPRFLGNVNEQIPTEDSKLTQEEQKNALSKLTKETYNPVPKRTIKPNYYIRDWAIISSRTDKEKDNEDGKRCAICLEDFEPKEVVTFTPCRHMFHEDCIVPWVKSQGRCPVCRFAICERMGEGAEPQGNNNSDMARDERLFHSELISVFRAMEDAFEWDYIRPFR